MKIKSSRINVGELTDLQRRFCIEYLKDMNATQSAIRAGYSTKGASVQATCLLANPRVQKELQISFARVAQKAEVDVESVLRELLRIANCDIAEAFTDHGTLKPIHEIPVHVRKCISSFDNEELFEMVETTSKNGRKVREWVGTLRKVKFWDKTRGLEMLGKYLAMFVDRNRFEDPDGKPLPAVRVNVINVKPGDALPKEEGLRATTATAYNS